VDGVAAIGNNASPVSNRLLNIDSLISPTAQYADVFGARIVVDASAYIDGNTVYGLYVNPKYRYFDVITAVVGAYIKPDVTSNVEMGD
ncbi:MAG: hypothetical protein GTN80_08165, partial [Nitrososphaeria archaeon]|nr:hypothetical protein [Nitrososphaeria archaeon]NIQ33597.1 hypothetical protein [Nitrososphaeria archaeon]